MSKGKLVAVVFVWLVILASGAALWKYVFAPAQEQAEQQHDQEVIASTSSASRYDHEIAFHLDSFSGYALLRSESFRRQLAGSKINLRLVDDGADYDARLKALQTGEAQLAVFTIDALLKATAKLGESPATIVGVLDETTGADAIVAYRGAVPNVDALNRPDMKFVLTMDSPSETLARVVMSRFQLDQLADDPFIRARDAEDVLRRYRQAKPGDAQVYVAWEPYVAKMLENSATHVLVDSSNFSSTIVDVFVVSRDYYIKNPAAVRDFLTAYLRVVYEYRDRDALLRLVTADARQQQLELSAEQAERLVDGIWWKNTQENLAHFGLPAAKSLTHIEDIIRNITDVLLVTGAIERDPMKGQPNALYLDKVVASLQNFHPGSESEDIRDVQLAALTEQQWQQLQPVGAVRMPELVFARGTDRLTEQSQQILDELAEKLTTTRYYVIIRGNASRVGNLEANQQLADQRAKAAERYLIDRGVDAVRIRAVGVEPSGSTSVSFSLGQMPY